MSCKSWSGPESTGAGPAIVSGPAILFGQVPGSKLRRLAPVARGWSVHEQVTRLEEHALLLVLREVTARGPQADCRTDGVHLRRVRRALHGHHPRGAQDASCEVQGWRAHAQGDLQGPGRLRDRPEPRQEGAERRRPQPLQAAGARGEEQRRRDREEQHPAGWPHRVRQDAAGADTGAHPGRAVHDGGCDHADRGRVCGRGCGEHHP